MKICIVSPIPPPYGGIGNWSLLLKGYFEEQQDLALLHINISPKDEKLEERSFWNRIAVKGCAMVRQRRCLKRLLITEKVNVMHLTTSGRLALVRDAVFLRVAKKANIPSVYHIHFGRIPQIAKENTVEWRMMKRNMSLTDCVISIDPDTLSAIKEYAPEVKVRYVPNPVDIQKITSQQAVAPKENKEIVFLGWVAKAKGVEELLSAWDALHQKYPEWQLRIVGACNDAYMRTLQKSFSLQNVIFEGERSHDDAMRILSNADVLALPSFTEGFPYAVLEAMALGRAIVATEVGAIPDMLDGDCGVVIPVGDVDALEHALEHLMQDEALRTCLATNAQRKAEQSYSIECVMAQYESIWLEVAKQK